MDHHIPNNDIYHHRKTKHDMPKIVLITAAMSIHINKLQIPPKNYYCI